MKLNDISLWDCFTCTGHSKSLKGFRVVGFNSRTAEPSEVNVAIITVEDSNRLPTIIPWPQIRENILSGRWAPSPLDLAPPRIRSKADIKERQQERFFQIRDRNYGLIRPILDLGWSAFHSHHRNKAIERSIKDDECPKKSTRGHIIKQLIWYWRSGGNIMVLGPDYSRCGSKTRKQKLADSIAAGVDLVTPTRRGPRIKIAPLSEEQAGPKGRGGCAIPLEAIPIIEQHIASYITERTKQEVIGLSLRRYRALPWNDIRAWVCPRLDADARFKGLRPKRRQIWTIGHSLDVTMSALKSVLSDKEMALNHRAKNGDYRDVTFGSGSLYEADPHRIDVQLVDDQTKLPAGRGTLIFIVDRASTLITGFTVTTDDADFGYMGRGLHCAFSNKPEWCKETLNIDLGPDDWPAEGLCDMISVDNLEMAGKSAFPLPELLADLGFARAYRGDDKPQVEVSFQVANGGYVHHLGYGISKGPRQRAQEDPQKAAVISVNDYVRGLVNWIVNDHSNRPFPIKRELSPDFIAYCREKKWGLTPKSYYKWSLASEHGPLVKYNKATMFPRLLDHAKASFTDRGLELNNLVFDLPSDPSFQLQKEASTFVGTRKLLVFYDRNSTNQVYLIGKNPDATPIRCPIAHLSRFFKNLTWAAAEIRWNERKDLTGLSERDHFEKVIKVRDDTRLLAENAVSKVKSIYGSVRLRNKVASALDPKETQHRQIELENDAARTAVEVEHKTGDMDNNGAPPAVKSRPSIYD